MKFKNLAFSLAFIAGTALSSQVMAATVLTFADTVAAGDTTFNFDLTNGDITLGAGASNGGLTAAIPDLLGPGNDLEFDGATFTLTDAEGGVLSTGGPISLLVPSSTEAGILTISDSMGVDLLVATFTQATVFLPFSVGANEVGVEFDNVQFSGFAVDQLFGEGAVLENESFSFALTNFVQIADETEEFIQSIRAQVSSTATSTASFTSSANVAPVPVPAALPLMFSGLLGGLLFGRKKKTA